MAEINYKITYYFSVGQSYKYFANRKIYYSKFDGECINLS